MFIETRIKVLYFSEALSAALRLCSKFGLLLSVSVLISCGSAPVKDTPTNEQGSVSAGTEGAAPSELSAIDKSLYDQAIEQLDAGDNMAAIKTLRKLERKYTANTAIKTNLATGYFKVRDFGTARDIVNAAGSNAKAPAQLQNISGLLFVEEKKFKQAEAAYQQALANNKDYATAHYNIALLYDIYFQDIEKAYAHYNRYLDIVGEDQETKDWVEQLKYSLDIGS